MTKLLERPTTCIPFPADDYLDSEGIIWSYIQKKVYVQGFESLAKGSSVSKSSVLYKLSPFIGSDVLMRVKGRLVYSSESYNYTISIRLFCLEEILQLKI